MSRRAWRGVWRLTDPKITLASAASMLLGASLAAADGGLAWGWLGVSVLGVLCLEAAKNASGEVFDWDSGVDVAVADADRSPFSGGKRVIVDGLLSRAQTGWIAALFYTLGIGAGLFVVVQREPRLLILGVVGVGLAYFYHAPPLRLAYRGLGELAVAAVYGPLIALGIYLVQRREMPLRVVVSALPLGLSIGAFLFINELPDRRADAASGKRTLVVRLGAVRAARAFAVILGAAYAGVLLLPLTGLPAAMWLGILGAPPAIRAARRVNARPDDTRAIIPAQRWTLVAFLLLAGGMSLGVMLASRPP